MDGMTVAFTTFGAIAAIIGLSFGVAKFVDWRIEQKIGEDSFIKKLAAATRPSLIVNEDNAILYDHGAMELLTSVTVTRGHEGLPEKIIVVPKRQLQICPLVQALDPELVQIEGTKGEGLSWVISLDYGMSLEPLGCRRSFRVELLL